MSDPHSHDIAKHLKVYIGVFVALLAGTLLTVGMYGFHFSSVAVTVAIAVLIATVKASLVAGFFMHLVSEKKTIYVILAFTAFFFAGLMALIIWAAHDTPTLTTHGRDVAASAPAAPHVP
jgi:cytochrome c oxidase subunit 4